METLMTFKVISYDWSVQQIKGSIIMIEDRCFHGEYYFRRIVYYVLVRGYGIETNTQYNLISKMFPFKKQLKKRIASKSIFRFKL